MTPRNAAQSPASATKTRKQGVGIPPQPITWQTASCTATANGWLFVLPTPMSANRSVRRGARRQYTPTQHRTDKAAAALRFGGCAQMVGDVRVVIGWVRERRQGDTDNRTKSTLDILKGVAYADDKQIADVRTVRLDGTTYAPGVYVWVSPAIPLDLTDLAA